MVLLQIDQKQDIGYIKKFDNENEQTSDNKKVIKVEKFVEKPDLETAKEYLDSGKYLWNAGMFIFNINNMLNELKNNYQGYNVLKELPSINCESYEKELCRLYPECEKISIDYAVMEKSKNIYVIPGNFGWDDIGTWNSLERYIEKDQNQNILNGDVDVRNSKNNIVYAGDKKIMLLDVDDVFVIDADDLLVIGKRDSIKKVHGFREEYNN